MTLLHVFVIRSLDSIIAKTSYMQSFSNLAIICSSPIDLSITGSEARKQDF